jgi:phosphate uptake regulator
MSVLARVAGLHPMDTQAYPIVGVAPRWKLCHLMRSPNPTMNRFEVSDAAEDLERQTLALVQTLVHLLDRALDAVVFGDGRLADQVVVTAADRKRDCQRVQEGVMSALGDHPAAGELQMLAALLQIVRGAERISAQCLKIATIVPDVAGGRTSAIFCDLVDPAARVSISEVWLAKQSFATRDVDLAHEVARADTELRRRSREIYRAALQPGEGEVVSPISMAAFLAASYLERIGDIAVDLAEQTVIVVNGLFREVDGVSAPYQAPATV